MASALHSYVPIIFTTLRQVLFKNIKYLPQFTTFYHIVDKFPYFKENTVLLSVNSA
ncbi:hypothetical protein T190611E02C_30412 [Tenacibaculum sp. 190524A05c]